MGEPGVEAVERRSRDRVAIAPDRRLLPAAIALRRRRNVGERDEAVDPGRARTSAGRGSRDRRSRRDSARRCDASRAAAARRRSSSVAGASARWRTASPSRSTSEETTRPADERGERPLAGDGRARPGHEEADRTPVGVRDGRKRGTTITATVGSALRPPPAMRRRRQAPRRRRQRRPSDGERADRSRGAEHGADGSRSDAVVIARHARIVLAPIHVAHRAHRRPVDAVLLADPARELELDQRRRDIPTRDSGSSRQLVDARRVLGEPGEQVIPQGPRRSRRLDPPLDPVGLEHVRAAVTGVAPSRSSAFDPAETDEVISPGTTITSRPSSSAKSAVISAPERSRASTTTVAGQRPAMILLRAGKRQGAGSTPGLVLRHDQPLLARSGARGRDGPPGSRGRCRSRARRP